MSGRARLAGGLLVIALAVVLVVRHGDQRRGPYRVDVVFDTAKGIVPGQLVKVAGARVGQVQEVTLTPRHQALLGLTVDRRFAPFHANATCEIKPEGLLSENFVECDPGTSATPVLRASGGTPTLPVTRTTVPVNLNDLFNIWNVPTRERLRLLVDELGITTAGRGADLNALLRRTNPALGSARRVLAILTAQDTQLGRAIDATDTATGDLARRPQALAGLIAHAAGVTRRTARASVPLGRAVSRLPGLLQAARPALTRLDATATSARPVLADVRRSAPQITRALRALPALSRATVPTARAVAAPLRSARRSLRALRPVVGGLAPFAQALKPLSGDLDRLTANLRDRGAIENVLALFYRVAVTTARFDKVSHMIAGYYTYGLCSVYAMGPVAGCSAHIGPVVGGGGATATHPSGGAAGPASGAPAGDKDTAPPPATSSPPQAPAAPAPPTPADPVKPLTDAVHGLLDYLLG